MPADTTAMPASAYHDDPQSPERSDLRQKDGKITSSHVQQTKRHKGRDCIDMMCTNVNHDLLVAKLFYFFFYSAFGSLFPLLAVYFKQLGLNATQCGVLIGFRPFVEFCSAPLWGGVADKWRKGKQILLFALFCWVAFTLAMAFIQPPAHSCIRRTNRTHKILAEPLDRDKRSTDINALKLQESSNLWKITNPRKDINKIKRHVGAFRHKRDNSDDGSYDPSDYTDDIYHRTRVPSDKIGRSPYNLDFSKITNANAEDTKGLVSPPFSSIVYREDQIREAFLLLLLVIIIGEFFSAPAITLADSATLWYLGDDTENYGKQRMFGSLGWGLAMFFVGIALDRSTTFPDHPCGQQSTGEKNYVICFAVFSVLMSCAFITATQFHFHYDKRNEKIPLTQMATKKKKVPTATLR